MFSKILVCAALVVLSHAESIAHVSMSRGPHPSFIRSFPNKPTESVSTHACAGTSISTFCFEDPDYPKEEIERAARKNFDKLLSLYADVADLSVETSVEITDKLADPKELYICPSDIKYVRPLQGQDEKGEWRYIVNNIQVHYQNLTQTVRMEKCLTGGDPCRLVPHCYESKCLQKSVFHRFLVYERNSYGNYDYFPFKIETFKVPTSCACLLKEFIFKH